MTMIEPESDRTVALPSRLRVRLHDTVPVVVVPSGVPFEPLREWIRTRVPEALPEIGGRACRLDLGDRDIELFDVRRLLHLLRDEFQIDVTGLYVRPAAIHRYAERELKLKLFPVEAAPAVEAETDAWEDGPIALPGLDDALTAIDELDDAQVVDVDAQDAGNDHDAVDAFEPTAARRRPIPVPDLPKEDEQEVDEHGGRRVLSLPRTLRSGAAIRYDGDVHVHGDVNAGAQIRAGGSVLVLGRLRGMVHAGANGDDSATILAFELSPTQLRIARHIAIAPSRPTSDAFAPELARVEDETIVIEPYGRRR
jgi:septum site-determining protein MinC